jgi:DNA-binding response OmpR family regulator
MMTTVLVIDDAPEIRDMVTEFLIGEGLAVVASGSAEEGLVLLDRSLPDLVILDGRLPGMSGWQCLELLRAAERTVRLPILMLTAAVDRLQTTAHPADDCTTYLAKPFDLDDLLASIHGVIQTCNQEPVAI